MNTANERGRDGEQSESVANVAYGSIGVTGGGTLGSAAGTSAPKHMLLRRAAELRVEADDLEALAQSLPDNAPPQAIGAIARLLRRDRSRD